MSNNDKIVHFTTDENQIDMVKPPQLKQQYSTLMEDLQQTTDKLLDQVFEKSYQPDIDYAEQQAKLKKAKFKRQYQILNYHNRRQQAEQQKNPEQLQLMFQNFINRNKKWVQNRDKKIVHERDRLRRYEDINLTFIPQILRGSKQKIQPLYQRTIELHNSREKKKLMKQIEKKKIQEKQYQSMNFQPQVNQPNKVRTLQQYLKDKDDWLAKKNVSIEEHKMRQKAKKYIGCTFSPQLVAKKYGKHNKGVYKCPQRVQDRLISSLDRSYQARLNYTN